LWISSTGLFRERLKTEFLQSQDRPDPAIEFRRRRKNALNAMRISRRRCYKLGSDSAINAYKFNETSNVRLQMEFLPVANG
jgi:hypothetical protein